jgi:hypothetical protein
MGMDAKTPWKNTLGYPLYSAFKQGLIIFQFLISQSLTKALQTIVLLLDMPPDVFF